MLQSVRAGLSNPKLVPMKLLEVYNHRLRARPYAYVMERDWDVLVVLDGCRYDLFEEVNDLDGRLSPAISPASCTREWLRRNFAGTYPDTVYVSANPQTRIHGIEDRFFESVRAWEDCWSEDLGTAVPDAVADRAIEVGESHRDKRVIVHFVQPHYPFVGEAGRRIDHRGFHERARAGEPVRDADGATVWDRLADGDVDRETVWTAYRENLALTLPHVGRIVESLVGKTVVTSDHGNALGEWGTYGHPCGRYQPALVRVPWLELHADERRRVVAGELTSADDVDGRTVDDRLADLGYVDE